MNFSSFPTPPSPYTQQSYTTDGKPVQTETYPPSSLGVNFGSLIGNQVTIPQVPLGEQPVTVSNKKKKGKAPKAKDGEITVTAGPGSDVQTSPSDNVSSRTIVENTVYADIYENTNRLTANVIAQTDELLRDCKSELDYIRSQRNMKGKYHYMNATVTAMSSLLGTKLAAIKEMNNSIKNANDMEYRRFKDTRALEATDDNKAIMDAYSAFISAPVGAPPYQLPTTRDITGGLGNVVRADIPREVQSGMDAGLSNYISNLTPEENLMLLEGKKDIEEVIEYDEATGVKTFKWINTKTGQEVPNLPKDPDTILEDYTIDPRTKLAKNTNLNMIKKVVIKNPGQFSQY